MKSSDKGYALLSVIAVLGALLVAGVAAIRMTRGELRGTADSVALRKAFYVAEAGVQRALAHLSEDRTAASTSTSYTYSEADQALGEGVYSVTVVQDPLFPTDASRKRITGVGTAFGQQATVIAQAQVQDIPPATICFTDTGTCKIQALVGSATQLFNGQIFSNNDAAIETTVGLVINGAGSIYARDRFYDLPITVAGIGGAGAVLSTLGANLYTGVAYTPSGVLSSNNVPPLGFVTDPHVPGLGLNGIGIHFANGANGHGQVQSIPARPFPQVDWESLRRDDRTVIVNAANVPSGTVWDASSETWIVGSVFAPPLDSDRIYYVEGNVHVVSLHLVKGARMTIAARGWSAVENLSVLNTGLVNGSRQDVRIIAQGNNTVGLKLLTYSPLQLETPLDAVTPTLGMASGVGFDVAGVASSDNRFFAYSETGNVWVKSSTVSALSGARFSVIAKQNATIAFTGSVASAVRSYQ